MELLIVGAVLFLALRALKRSRDRFAAVERELRAERIARELAEEENA